MPVKTPFVTEAVRPVFGLTALKVNVPVMVVVDASKLVTVTVPT